MAFNRNNLALLMDTIGGGLFRIHVYRTTDTDSQVQAAGYFTDVDTMGVKVDDVILCILTFDGETTLFSAQVTAIDADGDATVVLRHEDLELINEVDMVSNSTTRPPTQASVKAYARAKSQGTINYFANSTSGNDTTGTGSDSAPWATFGKAIGVLEAMDLNQTVANVTGTGTFAEAVLKEGAFVGDKSAQVTLKGPSSDTSACVINATGAAIETRDNARLNVNSMTLHGTTHCFASITNSKITGQNINFGASPLHIYASRGGYAEMNGSYEVSDSSGGGFVARHMEATHGGHVRWTGASPVCTVSGNLALLYWATADSTGDLTVTKVSGSNPSFNVTGSVTGRRLLVRNGGFVQWSNALGGGYGVFPGSIDEYIEAGGVFSLAASPAPFFVKQFTRDISLTGAQTITGIGFKPRGMIITGGVHQTNVMTMIGMQGFATQGHVRSNFGSSAGTFAVTTSFVCGALIDALNYTQAEFTSYDNDGATITWFKAGTPTGTAQFLAMFFA